MGQTKDKAVKARWHIMFFLFLEFNLFLLANDKFGNFRKCELPKKIALRLVLKLFQLLKSVKVFLI